MKLYIARGKDGSLSLHYSEPKLWAGRCWNGGLPMWLSPDMFPEVTFENSPQQVELKLVNLMDKSRT